MSPDNVTDTELAILQVLWEEGPATIRQIADRLYPEGTTSEYATVPSLLQRLEVKGYVRRDRRSFAHVFRAKVARERFLDQRLQDLSQLLVSCFRFLVFLLRAP